MANDISTKFEQLCSIPSDINEHLPTLSRYAEEAEVILEAGVRSVVSTWAFMNGLLQNESSKKILYSVDLEWVPIEEAMKASSKNGVQLSFSQRDILKYDVPEEVDICFIDTFHCYGQLRRELPLLAPKTKKYIILHDTTVDGEGSEVTRCNFDLEKLKLELGWSEEDLLSGLWRGVEEFLTENTNWVLHERYENNNGLTVLRRV